MAGDWMKLHRKSLDSRAFCDDWLWRLWCWCLLKACWKPCWLRCGRQLAPGQFVAGRHQAAGQLAVSPSKWYRGMHTLAEWGQITLEVNSFGTVVTICNWQTYQDDDPEERTAGEQPVDSPRTAGEQPVDTIEEGKEGKEGKNSLSRPVAFAPPTPEQVAAYCRERGNAVDAEAFVSHYQSNGWRVGRAAMKDWRAAVRTWEKNESKFNGAPKSAGNGRFDAAAFFERELGDLG